MAGKRILLFVGLIIIVLAAGVWQIANYLHLFDKSVVDSVAPVFVSSPSPSQPSSSVTAVSFTIESYVEGLEVPWAVVFTSDDRLLVTERPGRVRVVENKKLAEQPLYTFSEVVAVGEAGLMGMALDPKYQTNKFVYLCITYTQDSSMRLKVVRMTDRGDRLEPSTTLLDQVPAARFHAGCRLAFGPDQKLYVTVGDATEKEQAQDKSTLAGKVLRMNPDGSMPGDNPFPNSLIYSFGHRNPQGIAWHPTGGQLWATEHGPSGNDGPGGGDELNMIEKGGNYGWPTVSHEKSAPGMISPKLEFTPAVAPAAALFYTGDVFPQFKNNLFFAMLRGEGIILVTIDQSDPTKVVQYQRLDGVKVGRVRELVQGPDEFIYFTSSNRDGRGSVKDGDDHIYRLVPQR